MEIVYRKLKDIKPNPKNPRQSNGPEAIKQLAESIKNNSKFFEARPILLSDRTGELIIIAGERRSEAAALLKMKTVPTILISGLTEAEEDEILIKDNTHSGKWDESKLAKWDKEQLQNWNVDGVKWPKQETEIKEDNFNPDKKVKARCKTGDIWQLGKHRLMCGDSTDADCMAKLMNGEKADITITSPPYNAGHLDIPKSASRGGGTQKSTQKKYLADNDKKSDEEYFQFLRKNMDILIDNSFEVFYNIGVSSGSKYAIGKMMDVYSENFKDMIYWVKDNPMPVIVESVISSATELIMCFGKNGSRAFRNFNDRMFHGVIRGLSAATSNEYADIHKATFPIYLPFEIITRFSPQNGSVLDCFGGTGTTLIAAEQSGRKCFMMELDARYCDVIIERWEQYTGQKAKRIE